MNNFEVTLLVIPDITKKNLSDVISIFEKLLADQNGLIVGKEEWGLRDLAYKIKNFKKAFYIFFQIEAQGDKIQTIKKNLSLNENIIRQLFIKIDKHDKLPTKILESAE